MRNMVRYSPIMLFVLGIVFLISHGVLADSKDVTISTDQSSKSVTVTIADSGLNGKEITVICYDPGRKGNVNDLTGNKKYILYINQHTVKGTCSFTFKIKKSLVQGEYTLVVSSEKGQVVKSFRMLPEETPTPSATAKPSGKPSGKPPATATNKPASPTSKPSPEKKKILKAPTNVKVKSSAKKKVTVKWKKVAGAKGYIISAATKKKGTYKTKLIVKGGSKKKATLKKMKSGKVYYIKVRAYQLSDKKKVAGKWSKAKRVKVR